MLLKAEEIVLSVSGLAKSFGGLHAVRGVDFDVEKGAIVGLIGPNGAGKTTTFNMIAGELPPTAGKINLLGEDMLNLPDILVSSGTHIHLYGKIGAKPGRKMGHTNRHLIT